MPPHILATALSGCAGAPEYTKVVASPAPPGYVCILTSAAPPKALISPEAVASLIISRSGTTLDCRSWQRTIIRPGKLTARDARLYNINEKNELSALRLDRDVLHYGNLTLQCNASPTAQCQPFISEQGDNWVFSAAAPTRYWLTWFGLGVLWLLVQLPYPMLRRLCDLLSRMSKPFLQHRVRIVQRNLELRFPDMDRECLEDTVNNNFTSLGMGLMETGMAWFWSEARVKRWFDVSGLQHLQQAKLPRQWRDGHRHPFHVAGAQWAGAGAVPADDGHVPSS